MNKIDGGGSAFPTPFTDGWGEVGMTLRDYFAAKAMQASRSRNSNYSNWGDLAADAYEIADAMLAARDAGESA